MKFIFMLLILFVLTDPVLAKPANNTSECLQMYGNYMNKYGASKFIPDEQMLDFIGRCVPAKQKVLCCAEGRWCPGQGQGC